MQVSPSILTFSVDWDETLRRPRPRFASVNVISYNLPFMAKKVYLSIIDTKFPDFMSESPHDATVLATSITLSTTSTSYYTPSPEPALLQQIHRDNRAPYREWVLASLVLVDACDQMNLFLPPPCTGARAWVRRR